MGGLFSFIFGRKQPETPIKSPLDRCKNLWANNFRGLIAIIGALAAMGAFCRPNDREKLYRSVGAIWFIMLWFILWQPVAVQAVGLIPIFAFPLCGILGSAETSSCMVNENIVLMILGGWLHMLLNCSGMDKRIICCFLCSGGESGYSANKLLLKCMFAAFFLSMICNRLIVVSTLLEYVLPPLTKLSAMKAAKLELDFTAYNAIICNGIATSAAIGSLCIVHASLTTLQFKAIFEATCTAADIFNYLQYSAYAVPTAILMFLFNMLYHLVLLKVASVKKPMSKPSLLVMKTALTKSRSDLGSASCHEKASVVFLILSLVCYFTRWSKWIGTGWPKFLKEVQSPELPSHVRDATTAAIFVILLHLLPKTCDFFIKECQVKKTKDAPPLKMESGILFWKFIDKNTDYSYIFLIGGSIAVYHAVQVTGLQREIVETFETITKMKWNIGILIVVLVSVIFGNIMAGPGAQAILMPFMLSLAQGGLGDWPVRTYLVTLAVGIGTGFGFTAPFLNTTCYFSKHKGKVPASKQIKYALMSVLICTLILWVTLCFFAPLLWDPDGHGIHSMPVAVGGGAGRRPGLMDLLKDAATTTSAPRPAEAAEQAGEAAAEPE